MTYEGVLAVAALLLAIYQFADVARRESFHLFIRTGDLIAATVVSAVAVLAADLVQEHVVPSAGLSVVLLRLIAFGLPLGVVALCYRAWRDAVLTTHNVASLEQLLQRALEAKSFADAERIIRRNRDRLPELLGDRLYTLFEPQVVGGFLHGGSLALVELLADQRVATQLAAHGLLLQSMTRELLSAALPRSPLDYNVLMEATASYGLTVDREALDLFRRTYGDGAWFAATFASEALRAVAHETLRSGDLDSVYNGPDEAYTASEGLARRTTCPIFKVIRCHVLAIRSAIRSHIEGDFYVTNLWFLFQEILNRSRFDERVWSRPNANPEHPTPFAFLLAEIAHSLELLADEDILLGRSADLPGVDETSQPRPERNTLQVVSSPPPIREQVVLTWSLCMDALLEAEQHVNSFFSNSLVEGYLLFALRAKFAQHKLLVGGKPVDADLSAWWAKVLVRRLKERVEGAAEAARGHLRDVIRALDQGQQEVRAGQDWLERELGLE